MFEDIQPGFSVLPRYELSIVADAEILEGIFFEFRDPAGISALVEYSFVASDGGTLPGPAPLPLPPTLPLLGAAMAAVAARRALGRR